MADTAIPITAGTGTNVDTRTESTNGNHRQVVVVGDPATNDGIAPVDGTAGLKVDLGADNDVTVTSSALPTGAATAAKQPALGTAGTPSADVITVQGVTSMTALKVDGSAVTQPVSLTSTTVTGTVAVTQSGTWDEVGINDSGNSITVDNNGTFATQVDGAALTALQLIDDPVATDDTTTHSTGTTKVMGIGAVAAPTDASVNANDIGMPAMTTDRKLHVSVQDALPAGTNAIGKLSANSGVDIGDVDVTTVGTITPGTAATSLGKAEDAAHSNGDTGVYALAVRDDVPAAHSGTDGDYESLHTNRDGMLWVTPGPQESDLATQATTHVKKYYTNAGAVTDGIIWSPAAGKRWYVTDIFINVSAAATVTLEDDLAGGDSPVWKAELAANSGWSHSFETPLYSGEDAADLLITTSAGNVYVMVTGYEI